MKFVLLVLVLEAGAASPGITGISALGTVAVIPQDDKATCVASLAEIARANPRKKATAAQAVCVPAPMILIPGQKDS